MVTTALPAPPTRSEHVLFVHAHPDDETISTGGTLATLVDAGTAVTVLTCTRGECGEIVPPALQHLLGDGDAIAAHRESELDDAMRILGVTDHRWLGAPGARMQGREPRRYRDSGMVWGASGPEPVPDLPTDALCAADNGEIAADIATVIATTGSTAVVSYDAHGGYGHPDHVAAHVAARHAARVMSVPFYEIQRPGTLEPADLTHPGVTVVEIAAVRARKLDALRAYRSQLTVVAAGNSPSGRSPSGSSPTEADADAGDRIVMSGGQVDEVEGVEVFRRDGPARIRSGWADYRRGERVLACAIALLVGATVGALGTVNHQVTTDPFGIPVGLLVGLVVVAALLVGARLVFDNRVVTGFSATGLLGVIGVLSLESAGGSVLVPASNLAYAWIYGSVLIAALVLAWPKLTLPARDKIGRVNQPKGFSSP